MEVLLNPNEIKALMGQNPATENDGGWQSLVVKLQRKVDPSTGRIVLSDKDLDRIPKYAFDYGNGGWENTLRKVFGRVLGPSLGR